MCTSAYRVGVKQGRAEQSIENVEYIGRYHIYWFVNVAVSCRAVSLVVSCQVRSCHVGFARVVIPIDHIIKHGVKKDAPGAHARTHLFFCTPSCRYDRQDLSQLARQTAES